MSTNLMLSKKFAPLFWAQFFAAFNDNFLKNTLVLLIMATMAANEAASTVTLAGAVFMAPFLFFSALGGQLADKFDKAIMARYLKFAEMVAALVAVGGIAASSVTTLMVSLGLFGLGSALFGPIKYGILPDHLERKDLPKANAWIEAATFAAILSGTISAGLSYANGGHSPWVFGPLLGGIALISFAATLFIPETGRADPALVVDKNIFRSTFQLVSELRGDKRLLIATLIVSWFWLVGSIVLSILPPIVKQVGGGDVAMTSYLALFAIATAVGSAIAAWFSAGRIVLLPAVFGAILAGIFAVDLGLVVNSLPEAPVVAGSFMEFLSHEGVIHIGLDLFLIAVSGAFIVIPTFAALQAWAKPEKRARAIAANNVINAVFMTFGGLLVAGMQAAGAGLGSVAILLGVASVGAGVVMFIKLPTSPLHDFISILFRAFYRLEIVGAENLEKAGDTPIYALNHVSFLDAPLATILTTKNPVFAVNSEIAKRWWLKPFLKVFNAMPLDPTKPMATRTLIRCVEGGQPLVIFPEGRITVTGSLMKVYDGAAMVADKTRAKVVPIKIDGLEKTMFSRLGPEHGKHRWFPKVKVTILEPVTISIDPEIKGRKRRQIAGSELYKIMSNLVFRTSAKEGTVLEEVIKAGQTYGMGKLCVQDPVTGDLTYGKMLIGARVLGSKLTKILGPEKNVGVMLPNANGAAVTVLAVMSNAKVPAMINFTSGPSNILSACEVAEIETILTSKAFIATAKLGPVIAEIEKRVRIVYLDDLRKTITAFDKISGLINKTIPLKPSKADDPGVILFTSGSEGTPKGVVLSHRNVLANAAQAGSRIDFHSGDKVFNILPVFHSFGLTAGLILPLVYGVPVYLFPSPLQARIIPEAFYSSNSTIMFGTDTFLSMYARTAHEYDFQSMRYCFAGAEPVKASTRETWMNKFGVRILEGYGVTEAAPVLALNTPMYNQPGSVGKLLPSIEARLEKVPGVEEGGRLFIKGPNVMMGYLRAENPGVLEPLPEGWHDTGDIVTIDQNGFVVIKGRAKRFAKIGGEMISLAAVETIVAQLWPDGLSSVTNIPDAKKGERLVLVTENEKATRSELQQFAKSKGLSELAVPSEIIIAKVPLLGSGKIDFGAVKAMVLARNSNAVAA
jgi:acyl-[acyl-carrier-protein]-phospholipid O-acyltransferase/long-chain-fatty-acid--[acyl-carrier-protein] ligase